MGYLGDIMITIVEFQKNTKLNFRNVNRLAQGHKASRWQSGDSNLSRRDSKVKARVTLHFTMYVFWTLPSSQNQTQGRM